MIDVNGMVAVISGGSQGIGKAIGVALAQEGCNVVLVARDERLLNAAVATIQSFGGNAQSFVCDLNDQAQIDTVFNAIVDSCGSIDILVNNAGVGKFDHLGNHSDLECTLPMSVPVLAAIRASQIAVASMKKRGHGSIINILTPASYFPLPYMAPYTASRWALNGFSQSLHHELKATGIHVGTICPSRVETDYLRNNQTDISWWPRISSWFPVLTPEHVAAHVVQTIKKRRKERIIPWQLLTFVRLHQHFPNATIWLLEQCRLFQPSRLAQPAIEVTASTATNWEESIRLNPAVLAYPGCVDDVVRIVKQCDQFPSPVRTAGSRHSTTHCAVSDNGTLMIMRKMDRIIGIDEEAMTVTVEAGALYIDVAKVLEKKNLQFYVNVEIGNLTMGSAACTGTKDASFENEFGQVCSYLKHVKMVSAEGSVVIVDESDPDLLQAVRSSYGLLGAIVEVCFKVKPLHAMVVEHQSYTLDEFEQALPSLRQSGKSMMYYLFPFDNSLTVEFRHYETTRQPSGRKAWLVRNLAWKLIAPAFSAVMTMCVKPDSLRYPIIDGFYRIMQLILNRWIRSNSSSPTDQIIRYPERKGLGKYTFSIWAFPEDSIMHTMRAYYRFCQDYYHDNGYRCDMVNVGYRINQDQNPLFSYSYNSTMMTLDPVSTAREEGWDEFLHAYNRFCHEHNGVPLFNQSKWLTSEHVTKAFGERIRTFTRIRRRLDTDNRFLNDYFKDLFEPEVVESANALSDNHTPGTNCEI